MLTHHIFNRSDPETLYHCCMRSVSRNLETSSVVELQVLPPVIKSQLVLNVTRHSDGYGLCKDFSVIRSLLHRGMLHLDLSMYSNITDQTLRDLTEAAPNLREFRIANQPATELLTSKGLIEHITKMKHLRALKVSAVYSMNDTVLAAITRHCTELEVLEVNNNQNITDGCAFAIRPLKLSKLNLARTAVTDVFLEHINGGVIGDHIEEINLCHCAVTSAGLRKLQWDKMKYIGFEGAVINDLEFVKKMGNLKFIHWTIAT